MSLFKLAESCELATEPSEILDGVIEAALHIAYPIDLSQFKAGVSIEWEADEDSGRVSIYIGGRKFKRYKAPPYTASLDAAMTLVPEDASATVYRPGAYQNAPWAHVCLAGEGPMPTPHQGRGASDVLSLCAAALRARAASVDTHAKRGDSTQIEAPSPMGSAVVATGDETPND